ncbi:MAG: hypothetical protein QOF61_2641, partial [Acidobacteriota bacterium]|nr:hypothetical protein [Acidobacteriota bacterium]
MRKTLALLISLAILHPLIAPASAQQPTQTPASAPSQPAAPRQQQPQPQPTPPAATEEEDVVRITTNLVQLDAVVLDKHGKQVTNLKPEDFQIFEDGKPQKITNFSYVTSDIPANAMATTTAAPAAMKPDKNAPPVPPRRLRPEQVRRTVALVIDDLALSGADLIFARRGAREYVDKYVAPDDLVAVIRTSAGVGALQQFTSDRRQLYAALDHVRPFLGGNGLSTFAPLQSDPTGGSSSRDSRASTGSRDASDGSDSSDVVENFREEYFAVGTLGALNFVINGMRELPGRKSVVLFSPGFRLSNPDDTRGRSDRALIAARHLVDQANRASVVIYTIDPRGLVYTGPTAADDMSGMSGQQISDAMSERSQQLFETQEGNQFLSEQTGGFSIKNSNDLLPASRILEDLKGYYLIGYRPESETFDRRFHRLNAKLVNHPELHVRMRKGFYGISNEQRPATRRTREQQFIAALMSPLGAGDVRLRLTALFTNTAQVGSVVSSFMHVEASDIKFDKQPDGLYEAKVDLLGVTFTDSGRVVDQRGITQTLKLREDVYQRAQREGIVYTINVPIKKPGAYQLRVALRDDTTDKTGSASQFIEVPDLKKNRLALSGIVITGVSAGTAKTKGGNGEDAAQQAASGAKEGEVETRETRSSAAVRRFRQREQVDYACVIFDARADKATTQP